MKIPKKLSNYDYFLKVDTSPYKGEWVAITQSKIIAHGKDAQKVYKQAKKKDPTKDVSLAKVPAQQILVLTLLGRQDIFDKFHIIFKQDKEQIIFEKL